MILQTLANVLNINSLYLTFSEIEFNFLQLETHRQKTYEKCYQLVLLLTAAEIKFQNFQIWKNQLEILNAKVRKLTAI